ncbi:MAG: DUF1902 domain-containing protein [Methylovulum sp.]|nr:DUF1902 domain-containing protein [Methylovulum sp.]
MLNLPDRLEAKIQRLAQQLGQPVEQFLDKLVNDYLTAAPAFVVNVWCHEAVWTAECAALGLLIEADTYDGLLVTVRQLAPALAQLNRLDADNIRLRFSHKQAGHRLAE